MRPDWTLNSYHRLCNALLDSDRPLLGIRDFLERPTAAAVILRHDVDRFAANATRMATLEARLGIHSTYYVRVSRNEPEPAFLDRLRGLGHEIGYHYEVLAKTHGDMESALQLFRREIDWLRVHVPINTIAPHGSPISRWDSLRIWDHAERRDFSVVGDAYLDIDFTTAIYLTDTGRTWAETASNLRDRPAVGGGDRHAIRSTDELIATLPHLGTAPLCIQTHPERWNDTIPEYVRSWLLDLGSNSAKRIIRAMRPQQVRNREVTRD